VLDMAMPGMSGLHTIPFLLRASPTTRVALLTDDLTDAIVDEAVAAGAAGVLRRGESLTVIIEQLSMLATATPEEICISPEAWWVLGRSTIS